MLKAGIHFGHEVKKWNPRMKPFVYGSKSNIHIIDLQKTLNCTKKAMEFLQETTGNGGRVIFVGTKRQAVPSIQAAAEKSKQFYVTKRWLGGTLTNFLTIKVSIDRMKKIQQMKERFDLDRYSKKERNKIEKEYLKMDEYFHGIKDMKDSPAALFVIDIQKEKIAVSEAKKLNIPVVAIVDTNCDPTGIDYPIPANDDSVRSIQFFAELAADACVKGWDKWQEKLKQGHAVAQKKMAQAPNGKDKKQQVPTVTKVNRSRTLVAAGTAEDKEIELELDSKSSDTTTDDSSKK